MAPANGRKKNVVTYSFCLSFSSPKIFSQHFEADDRVERRAQLV
jgi:hypothetical protein